MHPQFRRFSTAACALCASGLLLLSIAALTGNHEPSAGSAADAVATARLASPLRKLLQSSSTRPAMFTPIYRPVATSGYTPMGTYR